MLVCQPPVKEMQITPRCCEDMLLRRSYDYEDLPEAPEPIRISSPNGLTLGDVLDAAERVTESHKCCPYAASHWHNYDTGAVETEVKVEGVMILRHDDPLFHPLTPEYSPQYSHNADNGDLDSYRESEKERQRRVQEIDDYISEKKIGK